MSWSLVGTSGQVHRLPQTMVFVGREDCDITIASRSVDKRHAVINYDHYTKVFTIKDIGSLNGTFINDSRICEQTYMNLQRGDSVRFGYDPVTYHFDQDKSVDTNVTHQSQIVRPTNLFSYSNRATPTSMDEEAAEITVAANDNAPIQDDQADDEVYQIHSLSEHESKTKYYRDILNNLKQQEEMTNGSEPSTGRIISPARGSPLYGLPDWWGEKDPPANESFRPRTGTFNKEVKGNIVKSPVSTKSPVSPTLKSTTFYTTMKHPTDLKPTISAKQAPTPDDTEVTLPSASNHNIGFTIDFNAKETAPKLSLNDSLSTYMPTAVKTKINESVKIVEELKAERKQAEIISPAPKRRGSRQLTELNLDLMLRKKSTIEVISPPADVLDSGAFRCSSKKEVKSRSSLSPAHLSVLATSRRMRVSKSSDEFNNDSGPVIDDDHLSDAGTYTIESENPPLDVERAREQIDEVFGVAVIEDLNELHLSGHLHGLDASGDDTDKDVDDMEDEDGIHQTLANVENQPATPVEPGTPTWISKWASMASNNVHKVASDAPDLVKTATSPWETNQIETLTTFCITSVQMQDVESELTKHPTFTRSPSDDSSPSPTADRQGRLSKNKRMLPVVPGDDQEVNDTVVTGNFKHSEHSAFEIPREHGEHRLDSSHEGNKFGTFVKRGRKSRGSVLNDVVSQELPVGPCTRSQTKSLKNKKDTWEGGDPSQDTECLLKDTENYMKSLESRVKQRTFSNSPDHSEGLDLTQPCFDADESDVDTTSNISAVKGDSGKSSKPPKGRHQRSRSDFSTKNLLEETKKDLRKRRISGQSNSGTDSTTANSTTTKTSGIWSRLSTPYKHKVSKDHDTMSDTSDVSSFARNSARTSSLPGSRRKSTSCPQKEPQKKAQTPKLQRKAKTPLPQPRETRSTRLRKSRFDDQDTSELSDTSPKSSISDLGPTTYVKRPFVAKSSTSNAKLKPIQSRVKCGQPRPSLGSSRSTPSVANYTQSQAKKLPSSSSSAKLPSASSSAKVNLQAKMQKRTDVKATGTKWRRYDSTGSETDTIDAYIKNVTSRKQPATQVSELKNDSRRRRASFGQRSQLEVDQRRFLETSLDDVVDRNGRTATEDDLYRGEGDGEEKEIEEVAKDEKMLDEIFAENSVNVTSTHRRTEKKTVPPEKKTVPPEKKTVPPPVKPGKLYRPTSLEFDDSIKTSRKSPAMISPEMVVRMRNISKMEPFDNLLLASVNHLSHKLKSVSDELATKIRKTYKDPNYNDHIQSSRGPPLLKAGNQEIALILHNLRQVEKHLTEINRVMDSGRTSSPRMSAKSYKQSTQSKPRLTSRSISASASKNNDEDDDEDMYF